MLVASCIEVIGFILTSVKDKPEVCKKDAVEITNLLVAKMTSGNLVDSDPQVTSISNCLA